MARELISSEKIIQVLETAVIMQMIAVFIFLGKISDCVESSKNTSFL